MTVNSVRLGPDIDERLAALATRLQRSKSHLIRRALLEYFERHAAEAAREPAAAAATMRVVSNAA